MQRGSGRGVVGAVGCAAPPKLPDLQDTPSPPQYACPHPARCASCPARPRSLRAVSEAQQADPRLLAAVYDDMAEKFQQHGLNLPAVEAMQQYFEKLEGEGAYCPFPVSGWPWQAPMGAAQRPGGVSL